MESIVNSPMNRHERIRSLRIKLIVHRRMARHNTLIRGPEHYDVIYHWDVVEELSATLSNELRLLEIELENQKKRHYDGWDIGIMNKSYEI